METHRSLVCDNCAHRDVCKYADELEELLTSFDISDLPLEATIIVTCEKRSAPCKDDPFTNSWFRNSKEKD